ncbi:hypothetical protein FRC08_012316 [Ceratobasidium sp. 394]|nr:hypothetical protein FRC08_012316 [Ceratobasidium sp. 394]KAG9091335.1 hypothetical protein FS749_016621 [Ceratobasidium sp. UAMH 11750]
MFVLQECSICFEDFDNDRNPFSIPCGHVFCHPCLNSLVDAPKCPNCRRSFAAGSIRRVVCAQQESGMSAECEEETVMWQAIKNAVEAPNEYEQRKSLVKHNPLATVRQAGMSAKLLIVLTVLRMLVEAEQRIHALKDGAETAEAVKESLCDHISTLEAQLGGETSDTGAGPRGMQLLLAQVRALQASVQLVKSDTSTIIRHLDTDKSLPPIQLRPRPQAPTPAAPNPAPGDTQGASTSRTSWSSLLRPVSSQNANNNSNSSSAPTVRVGSNPAVDRPPQPAQSSYQGYLSRARAPSISGSDDTWGELLSLAEASSVGARVRRDFAGGGAPSSWGNEGLDDWPGLDEPRATSGSPSSRPPLAQPASPPAAAAAGPVTDADGFTAIPSRRGSSMNELLRVEREYRGRGRGRGGSRGEGGGYGGGRGESSRGYRGRGGNRGSQSGEAGYRGRGGSWW